MSLCEPVVRTCRVGGSCREWFPVVLGCLHAHGFSDVSADLPSLRLSGAYSGGFLTVAIAPSDDGSGAVISVSAAPCGGVPC